MNGKHIKWWKIPFHFIKIVFEIVFDKRDSKNVYKKVTDNERRKQFKKKALLQKIWWGVGIIVLIVSLTVFPALINYIILYNGEKLSFLKPSSMVAEDNDWIGFLGSYTGSIIGGVIGGAMTLIGVILTIRIRSKEDLIESYAERRKHIRKLKRGMENLNKILVENFAKNNVVSGNLDMALEMLGGRVVLFEKGEKLSDSAGKVDGFLLMVILDFIEFNESLHKDVKRVLEEYSAQEIFLEMRLRWNYTYNTVMKESDEILSRIESVILKERS